MKFAKCTVSVAPVRREPLHQSEMVTQMLYGETCGILEKTGNFYRVKMHFDGYEGYLHQLQLEGISQEEISLPKLILTENFSLKTIESGRILLSCGSELESPQQVETTLPERSSVVATAASFLNVPYLWSGRSFFGIDCSGLVQLVYKLHGVALPRDAYQQAEVGTPLSFLEESQPGDLAFFEDENGNIVHTGMLLADNRIIHASGKVRIDELDSSGIYNRELQMHTYKLRFIRNILD